MYILVLKKRGSWDSLFDIFVCEKKKLNFALIYPKFYKFGKFIDKIEFG